MCVLYKKACTRGTVTDYTKSASELSNGIECQYRRLRNLRLSLQTGQQSKQTTAVNTPVAKIIEKKLHSNGAQRRSTRLGRISKKTNNIKQFQRKIFA